MFCGRLAQSQEGFKFCTLKYTPGVKELKTRKNKGNVKNCLCSTSNFNNDTKVKWHWNI